MRACERQRECPLACKRAKVKKNFDELMNQNIEQNKNDFISQKCQNPREGLPNPAAFLFMSFAMLIIIIKIIEANSPSREQLPNQNDWVSPAGAEILASHFFVYLFHP